MQSARYEDTIAAIATAAGGGIGIIRISGPDAISTASRVFKARASDWYRHARVMAFGRFVDPSRPTDVALDEGLAVAFHEPKSYTGEDVVELHLHGGALHLRRCLEVILGLGTRLAEPGEFTRRAFLNGQIDLTRAEAVADLVTARTDRRPAPGPRPPPRRLHDRIAALRERMLDLRARLEVNLDFVDDEDVPGRTGRPGRRGARRSAGAPTARPWPAPIAAAASCARAPGWCWPARPTLVSPASSTRSSPTTARS